MVFVYLFKVTDELELFSEDRISRVIPLSGVFKAGLCLDFQKKKNNLHVKTCYAFWSSFWKLFNLCLNFNNMNLRKQWCNLHVYYMFSL